MHVGSGQNRTIGLEILKAVNAMHSDTSAWFCSLAWHRCEPMIDQRRSAKWLHNKRTAQMLRLPWVLPGGMLRARDVDATCHAELW